MKKITLLLCLFAVAAFGQNPLTLQEYVDAGLHNEVTSVERPEGFVPSIDTRGANVTVFTDRTDYLANCLNGDLLTLEDFADGPGGFLVCSSSISSVGDNCYAAGEIQEGIEFTTSGADVGNGMVAVVPGDGFTLDNAVGSVTFVDFTIINFTTVDPVTSVGFDLYSLTGGSNVDIRVIGAGGPIDTVTADVSTTGPVFVGLLTTEPIVSIEIEDITGANVELVAQVLYGSCEPLGLNDDPETASNLLVGEVFEDNPRIGDNTEATATAIDDPSCGSFTEADLWYRFVVPESGSVTVESRLDDGSDVTDTALSIYEGEIGALVEVVCNDDGGIAAFSLAEVIDRTPGEVLYARVWEFNGGSVGTFQISAYDTPPPANDDPEGAIALTVGSVFADFPLTASNVSATDTAIDDPTCGNYGGADVWFTVVVPSTGQVNLETDTAGGITDTGMSLYTGEIGALVELGCDDDDGNGLFSLVEVDDPALAGMTLFVRVWEWGGGGFGPFQVAAYSNCFVDAVAIEITGTGETEMTICTTDGIPDPIEVTIVGEGVGTNSGWVITDQATGEILGLPMAPPFDLDGVEPGICEIWYIRFEEGLTGLETGANVGDLEGCFDLSNPIAVTRSDTICPPSNNDCENAIALECDTTVVGSTLLASDSGSNAAPDVFYTYTGSGGNENITISLCDGATDYDSFLRVFDDECALVNEIAQNDDSCGLQSQLTFLSDGVTTYTIMVEGFGAGSGNYSLAVTCEALPDCLQPEGLAVANLTEVSADLSWTDVNNPVAGSYDVEWGETGFTLGTGTVEAGVANPFTLGGLTANTTYDFYVVANCSEDDSSEASGPATFTTTAEMAPPGECEYTLQMFDSFGDGWNGALLNVFRNGQVVLLEVSLDDDPANDGDTGSLTFEILPGDDITTVLVDGGGFPGEISYNILAVDGATVIASGDADNDIVSGTLTASCVLSVDDNTLEGFSFFPNPAQDVITLDARTAIEDITLYNLLGQKVLQQKVDGLSNYQLNVSTMAKGTYLMQVTTNEGKVGVYRVLKM